MSGAQTSTFPPANVLMSTLSGQLGTEVRQNQLMNQQKEQAISAENMAQVGQAAAGLLSAYPDEASRAVAYAPLVGFLQSQGYAKNAPAQYPGEGTLRAIVNASVSPADQYKMGLITSPQAQANFNSVFGASGTGTGTGTPTTAAPATTSTTGTSATPSGPAPFVGANLPAGVSPDEDQLVRTVYGEARGEPVAGQQAVASVIKTRMGLGKQGVGDVVFAPNQFEAWSDPKNRPGMEALSPTDPQYQAILNNVVRPVMSGQAQDPTGGATNFYNPTLQAQLGRSTPGFAQGNQTTIGNHTFFYGGYAPRGAATATAQPAAAPAGGGGTQPPAPTQFAGPGAPPGSTAPAAPAPETPWDLPGAPAPDLPPPATPTAAGAPAPTVAPASTAPGPAAQQPPPATGANSPNFQRAMQMHRQAAMLLAGPGGQLPQNVAMANYLNTNADALLKVDTFQDLGGGMQRNTLTGEVKYGGPPTARSTTDNAGNTWILAPGQQPVMLHANTSGVTGSGPEASALRTMNEIAPKIQAGIPLTPQEQANYASATEIYRNPTIVENANTGERVRAYTRDLPPGFPPPPGSTAVPQSTTPLPPGPTTSTSAAPPPAPSPPPAPNSSQSVVPGIAVGTKKSEEQLGTDFAGGDKKAYDASVGSLGMLANANNAAAVMNSTPGSWTATGPAANTRLELAKTVNGVAGLFGLQPPFDPTKVSAWEALTKQTKLMGMQVVNNYFGGSREAASIINGATSAVPNAENSYLGFRLVSSGIEQDLLRQQQLYEYKAQKVAANQPLSTAETEFNQTHPVEMYTARAIANAIPDDLVAKLQANPSKVADFDQHFGPGIGEFILKGGRTQMVAPAQVPR